MTDIRLLCGDCIEQMAALPENSVDSVVTDAPYHLTSIVKRFGKGGAAAAQFGTDGAFARASRGFMGKEWDGGDIAFRPEVWRQCLRVLKPGGHLLAFGGSKGFYRMAVAIEDAGFEIRDTLMWLYGTGFPKSLDVAKAIDKSRREDVPHVRAVCRFVRAAMDARKLRSADLTQHFGNCNPRLIDHWAARDTDSQPNLPTPEQWAKLKWVLGLPPFMDAEVARLNARKGELSDTWNSAEVVGEYSGQPGGFGDHRFGARDAGIRAMSEEAAAWEGWGTALKPAFEPIVMGRKELDGTVAANVLKWRTGALNIDACRIDSPDKLTGEYTVTRRKPGATMDREGGNYRPADGVTFTGVVKEGRWPANVVHDGSDEVVSAFPVTKSGKPGTKRRSNNGHSMGAESRQPGTPMTGFGDAGSASRFFYCAKATTEERADTNHPTVKPQAPMRYLVRLVTPPGGVVLDCFAGSGSTGWAARDEGFDCILIEREAEYQADIRRRLGLDAAPSLAEFMATKQAPTLADFLAGKT